ncbi:MAG TPA: hypothetical protein VK917_08730 [Ilumatobacter sp.]|nr:hypothetical protein [Ilumatobacter sp.]
MSVQVWFSQEEISVRPGEATSLSLAVENVGDHTQSYTVIPAGLTAAWTTVTRPNITLFGGSRDVVEVVVRPPAIHSTTAGPTALAVRVIPQDDPDESIVAETIIVVLPFDDRRVTTLQPVQRARHRATYEFMVENHGNNLASCRLHLVDASNRVDGSFDPPAVGVAPGSASLVRLNLKAQRGFFRRAERQLDFEIEATEPDHDPAAGRATLIQPPTISGRSVARALGLAVAIAAIVGAWFGVVRPELRDAASDAVDDRLDELPLASGPDVSVPEFTVPVDEPQEGGEADAVVTEPLGEPVAYRIAVDVGIANSRSESVSIPPDSRFHLTDVVPQNPNGDLGTAQLLRNGDILYEWDLGSMTSANEFQPRITPIPFEPSDNIVLAVDCEVAGETTGTGCQISVLLGGRLLPAQPSPSP